ncbi:hypothetical protein VTI74DRAFT_3787 [Chaetomium olivicolor]
MADQHVVIILDTPSPPPPPPPPLDAELDIHHFDIDRFLEPALEEASPMPPVLRSDLGSGSTGELSECEKDVLDCFPDICPEHLKKLASIHGGDSQRIIHLLLDELDMNRPYPKRQRLLKRKRPQEEPEDEEAEMRRKFEKGDPRRASKGREYAKLYIKAGKALLKSAFPNAYSEDVENVFKDNNFQLYSTYVVLDRACSNPGNGSLTRFKKPMPARSDPVQALQGSAIEAERDALVEFQGVHAYSQQTRQARAAQERERQQKDQQEKENWERAKAEGTVDECGCCFSEFPRNRMVHCNADTAHWFCRVCARAMAENAIGLSKYQLNCMSIDGCDAVLAPHQKGSFLDAKLIAALDDIEQEAVLRMAGIENLATCPFCRYAAEYPSVEVNKEFTCENEECGVVSCRLCREETHIPKSCEEAARERGHSARHKIEEAMSAAMIRKCNKCQTPFIKENGCNKMTCTRAGCRNVQCYVCSASCDYSHFDRTNGAASEGKCPLFDSVEQRHEEEVQSAMEQARKQVAEENPHVTADLLEINFSDKVKQDDQRRKAASNLANPQGIHQGVQAHPGAHPAPRVGQAPPPPPQMPGPMAGRAAPPNG